MLQSQTTPRKTFALLERLMQDPVIEKFNLAGGTALALYMGHRKSIDLDLFSQKEFDTEELENHLVENYNFVPSFIAKNTLTGFIESVKIDCITSFSKLCKPIRNEDNIRLYSPEDIIAMKLLAIADNGTRLKDFVDIAYLSAHYSLNDMIEYASEKFPNKNPLMFEKGLSFKEDINHEEIELMKGDYKWKFIEDRLEEMIRYKDQIFNNYPIIEEQRRGFRR